MLAIALSILIFRLLLCAPPFHSLNFTREEAPRRWQLEKGK